MARKKPIFPLSQSFRISLGKLKPTPLLYSSLHTVIKLFAIAFTCVYLHLTVGVVKTTHYCMGRESYSTLYSFKVKRCPCNLFLSNLEKNSCCHDESELIVLDDDQSASASLSLSPPAYFFLTDLQSGNELAVQIPEVSQSILIEDSPPPRKEPIYKVLCNYTLYEEALVA
jgi:hypothetical protein